MKRILNYLIFLTISVVLASCAGNDKSAKEQPIGGQQAVANQSLTTEQPATSAVQPEQTLPGTQTQPATQPQKTITQPAQTQTSTSEIIVGNEIGNDLGDFVNYSPDSTLLNLSSLRGKLVMVMLWNSLCHHCVIDNEKLRETYNNFHNKNFKHGKGFEIYAIGLDKERETWMQALTEKKYPWKYNVYVIDSWKDRDVRFFGIKNLPGYFLIDRDGIVVNKMFTADELDGILQGYLVN